MSDIKWEDPPKSHYGRGGTKWREIFEALRSRPGVWALVLEEASPSMTTQITQGRLAGSATGEFEATFHATNGRRGRVYARYVGADVAD